MKTPDIHHLIGSRVRGLCAAGFVSLTCMALAQQSAGGGSSPPPAVNEKESAGFLDSMRKWQEKMSDLFRDTWAGWQGSTSDQSIGAASVDLREKQDSYMVRLNLPGRSLDAVDVRLDGSALHIIAPAEKNAGRYEQVLKLEQAQPDAKLAVERKQADHLIVITVPKSSTKTASVPVPLRPTIPYAPLDVGESNVFARMEKMQREMDRIFNEAFTEFRPEYEAKGFFDRPRFDSSIELNEDKENYVVRAYLPARNMENVNVKVEGNALKIEASAEEVEKKGEQDVKAHRAHYEQVVTLPGPFKAEKMKVDKKQSLIVVTLPKA